MLAMIWILALAALGLWSLAAWALYALLTSGGDWLDDIGRLADKVPFGDVLERWLPGWRELLEAMLHLAQTAFHWVGDHAVLVAWVTWGLGAFAVLALAAGGSLIAVLLRDSKA